MPINISTLIEDPEFKSLPPSDKRILLSESDPEFSNLSDEEIQIIAPPQARVPDARTPQQGILSGDSPYKDVVEAIPFSTALPEFKAGMESGRQLVSPAVTGPLLGAALDLVLPGGRAVAGPAYGATLGTARALASALNPLGKLFSSVPKAAQATGSLTAGDLEGALRDITGSNPLRSGAEIPTLDTGLQALDVPANTLGEILNEAVVKQPLTLAGLTPRALSTQARAVSNVTKSVADSISSPRTALATMIGREPVPILSRVLDYADSETSKITNLTEKAPPLFPEIKSNVDTSIVRGGEKMIQALETTLEKRYDTYYPVIEKAPSKIITRNLGEEFRNNTISDIRKALDESGVSKNDQAPIISELIPEIESLNSVNIVNSTKLLNRQVAPLFKSVPTPSSLSNAQMIARSALRDSQSNAIHGILKDLGFDSKIYGDVGILNEIKNRLSQKYIGAKNDLNQTLGESLNQSIRRGLKQGVGPGLAETGERLGARISRGKVGEIDRAMDLLLNQVEASTPQFSTGSVRSASPTASPPSLEEAIRNSQSFEQYY